jgi:two-component system, OmpR family, KDP operon response regulator KdpE
VPIIPSVHDDGADKITALDAGADEYVTKPFSMAELLALVRATSRWTPPAKQPPTVRTEDLTVDLAAKRVTTKAGEVWLTRPNGTWSSCWSPTAAGWSASASAPPRGLGPQAESETAYLHVHMARIRRKLEPEPAQRRYFITAPGMGYRFESEQEAGAQ